MKCSKSSLGRSFASTPKPCILINTLGYWDGLLEFLDSNGERRLLKPENRALLQVAPDASEAVRRAVAQFIP